MQDETRQGIAFLALALGCAGVAAVTTPARRPGCWR